MCSDRGDRPWARELQVAISTVTVYVVMCWLAGAMDDLYEGVREQVVPANSWHARIAYNFLNSIVSVAALLFLFHFGPVQEVFIHRRQMKEIAKIRQAEELV